MKALLGVAVLVGLYLLWQLVVHLWDE